MPIANIKKEGRSRECRDCALRQEGLSLCEIQSGICKLELRLSKSKIDQVGERLKNGAETEADLILLDQYRQSFHVAYEKVFEIIGEILAEQKVSEEARGE